MTTLKYSENVSFANFLVFDMAAFLNQLFKLLHKVDADITCLEKHCTLYLNFFRFLGFSWDGIRLKREPDIKKEMLIFGKYIYL